MTARPSAARRLRSPRHRQRGGVMMLLILVLIVLSALIGVLAVRGATSDLRMSGSQREERASFYCAEAGLNAARAVFGAPANAVQWNILFSGGTPTFDHPFVLDLDKDEKPDVSVTLEDDYDEFPTSDRKHDNNLTAIMTATCISTTLVGSNSDMGTRVLKQIITYAGAPPHDYRFQAGHSSTHSGNAN